MNYYHGGVFRYLLFLLLPPTIIPSLHTPAVFISFSIVSNHFVFNFSFPLFLSTFIFVTILTDSDSSRFLTPNKSSIFSLFVFTVGAYDVFPCYVLVPILFSFVIKHNHQGIFIFAILILCFCFFVCLPPYTEPYNIVSFTTVL